MTDKVDAFRHWVLTHNRDNYGRYDAFAAGATWQREQDAEIASGHKCSKHDCIDPGDCRSIIASEIRGEHVCVPAYKGRFSHCETCGHSMDAKQENAGPVVGRKGDQGAKHEGPTASSLCPGCGYPWTDHVLGEQGSSVCEPKADPNQDNAVCPKRSPHGGHFEAAAFPGECFYCSKKMRAHEVCSVSTTRTLWSRDTTRKDL